jgi:hypothetical protein
MHALLTLLQPAAIRAGLKLLVCSVSVGHISSAGQSCAYAVLLRLCFCGGKPLWLSWQKQHTLFHPFPISFCHAICVEHAARMAVHAKQAKSYSNVCILNIVSRALFVGSFAVA